MSYDDNINRLIQDANRNKRVAMMMANFLKSGKAKRFIEPLEAMKSDTISYQVALYGNGLYFYVKIKDLKSFKGADLEGILNVFEYMNPSSTSSKDYPEDLHKEFSFWWLDVFSAENPDSPNYPHKAGVYVNIEARVVSDSPTCRQEVIGYTDPIEPAPIYKLVCDDEQPQPATTGEQA